MDVGRFKGLIAIQQRISAAGGDLAAVMEAIVAERSVLPQSNGICIELRDGDHLVYAAASGTSQQQIGLRLPLNASLSGMSVLINQPLYCRDSETDARVNRKACRQVGLRSMIVVPIPHQGQVAGVLKYHSADPDAYGEEDMLFAHLLVGPIAVGMSSVAEADAERGRDELSKLVQLREELVSTVSHELRTPITAIAGSLSLLDSGMAGALPESACNLVSVALRNANRLSRLVNDLLDLDKLDAGKLALDMQRVDLRAVMRDALEQNAPFAAKTGVQLVIDLPAYPVWAITDAARLVQTITNLVSNAAKFSPKGSIARLTLGCSDALAHIRISDNGPGIPTDFRDRMFDRFAQSAEGRASQHLPGTGLGLAISQAIVRQLGGTISLDEHYRDGAAFDIFLPMDVDGAAGIAAA